MTAIIFTAADGWRAPIVLILMSTNPRQFNSLYPGLQIPLFYREQNSMWFDKEVTQWCISTVFWSEHMKKNGDMNAVPIIDYNLSHNIYMSNLFSNLKIKFFPLML